MLRATAGEGLSISSLAGIDRNSEPVCPTRHSDHDTRLGVEGETCVCGGGCDGICCMATATIISDGTSTGTDRLSTRTSDHARDSSRPSSERPADGSDRSADRYAANEEAAVGVARDAGEHARPLLAPAVPFSCSPRSPATGYNSSVGACLPNTAASTAQSASHPSGIVTHDSGDGEDDATASASPSDSPSALRAAALLEGIALIRIPRAPSQYPPRAPSTPAATASQHTSRSDEEGRTSAARACVVTVPTGEEQSVLQQGGGSTSRSSQDGPADTPSAKYVAGALVSSGGGMSRVRSYVVIPRLGLGLGGGGGGLGACLTPGDAAARSAAATAAGLLPQSLAAADSPLAAGGSADRRLDDSAAAYGVGQSDALPSAAATPSPAQARVGGVVVARASSFQDEFMALSDGWSMSWREHAALQPAMRQQQLYDALAAAEALGGAPSSGRTGADDGIGIMGMMGGVMPPGTAPTPPLSGHNASDAALSPR